MRYKLVWLLNGRQGMHRWYKYQKGIPGSVNTQRVEEGSTDAVNMKYLGVGAEHDVLRMIF